MASPSRGVPTAQPAADPGSPLAKTFHRRELKAPAVAFSSPEGRQFFSNALEGGFAEAFFRLFDVYQTQSNPAYCGITSMQIALNALLIDPGRVWQGAWRWFDDSLLDCCEDLSVVQIKGITMDKLACLGRCNGASVWARHADGSTFDEFVTAVEVATAGRAGPQVLIISYGRSVLNQTGTGHFSPIGSYDPKSRMVLMLDTARFKYPPHWVPIDKLWEAMGTLDTDTGKVRGYLVVAPSKNLNALLQEQCCDTTPGTPTGCCDKDKDAMRHIEGAAMGQRLREMCKHQCRSCSCGAPDESSELSKTPDAPIP